MDRQQYRVGENRRLGEGASSPLPLGIRHPPRWWPFEVRLLANLGFGIACFNLNNTNMDGGYCDRTCGGGGRRRRWHRPQQGEEIMGRLLSQRHSRRACQGEGVLQLCVLLQCQPTARHQAKRRLHQAGVPPGNRVRGGDASTGTLCLNGRGT
jgi:hypothetical protein